MSKRQKPTAAILVCISLCVLGLTAFGSYGLTTLRRLQKEEDSLQVDIRSLESEIARTNNKIYGLEQNKDFLERAAREQLGLAKPGEIVYVFPDKPR